MKGRTEGLVLQERTVWEGFIAGDVVPENNATDLYFEETDIEAFDKKLHDYEFPIKFVNVLLS